MRLIRASPATWLAVSVDQGVLWSRIEEDPVPPSGGSADRSSTPAQVVSEGAAVGQADERVGSACFSSLREANPALVTG